MGRLRAMYAKRFSIRLGTIHQRPSSPPYTIEAVVDYNVVRHRASGHPVATIKVVHAGPNALSEDAGGLESIICLVLSLTRHLLNRSSRCSADS